MTGIPISKLSITKAGLYQKIRSGLFLSLRVGKTLTSGEQEASINGKTILLPKSTGLIRGRIYNVQYTVKKDGSLILHIPKKGFLSSHKSTASAYGMRPPGGTDKGIIDRQVMEIIGKSGLLPSGLLIDKLTALVKDKKPDVLGKVLLSILLGKRILPDRGIYEELLPLFSGGEDQYPPDEEHRDRRGRGGSSGGKKKESKSSEITPDSVKSVVALESEYPTLLHLVNALPGEEGQWIIIPLPTREEKGDHLKGTMRLLIDPAAGGKVKRIVLSLFDDDSGGYHFLFRYPEGGDKPLISLYLPEYGIEGLHGSVGVDFLKKMDNLGFKIDDIQREDSFTGYDSNHAIPDGIDLEV